MIHDLLQGHTYDVVVYATRYQRLTFCGADAKHGTLRFSGVGGDEYSFASRHVALVLEPA